MACRRSLRWGSIASGFHFWAPFPQQILCSYGWFRFGSCVLTWSSCCNLHLCVPFTAGRREKLAWPGLPGIDLSKHDITPFLFYSCWCLQQLVSWIEFSPSWLKKGGSKQMMIPFLKNSAILGYCWVIFTYIGFEFVSEFQARKDITFCKSAVIWCPSSCSTSQMSSKFWSLKIF